MLIAEVLIVLVLIAFNGVLAMSELAVVSSRRGRLKHLVDQGRKGARRAQALAADPGRFLSTVQIGITLVGILAGAFSGATIGVRLGEKLVELGLARAIAEPAAVGLVVAAITYLSLILGELVPKQVALRNPESIACAMAPWMAALARVSAPIVWLLDHSSRLVLRLIGRGIPDEARVTEEEIRSLVAEAETAGVLEPEERAMISGVMRLADRPVRAVMTPRPDVDLIDLAEDAATIRRVIAASPHSRLPVCDGDPDVILGIIQAKDLLDAFMRGEVQGALDQIVPRKFVRPAPIVPDTMDALDVVTLLKESAVHIGLVHDEYGHFEGVVTSADILEAIVGVFRTEEGPAEPNIVKRADGSYLVAGSMHADELAELLGIPLPAQRSYHTVAGFVLARFGHVPEIGEFTEAHGWRFEVVDLDGRRIDKVLIAKGPPPRRMAAE